MVKQCQVFSLFVSVLFFGIINAQARSSLYDILGVSPQATAKQIKTAYRKKALQLHPDRNPISNSHEQMQQINKADEILSNETNRALYDQGYSVEEIEDPTLRATKDAAKRRHGRSTYQDSTSGYGSSYDSPAPSDEEVDQAWQSEYRNYRQNSSASRSSSESKHSSNFAGRSTGSFVGGQSQWMKEWREKQQRRQDAERLAKDVKERAANEDRLRQKQAELEAIQKELARRKNAEKGFAQATQAASWQANLSAFHKGSKGASTANKLNSTNEINQELTRLRAKKARILKTLQGEEQDDIDAVLADDPDMQRLTRLEQDL